MSDHIYLVMLYGDSGSRFWRVSRKSYPKQFAPLIGHESLFMINERNLDMYEQPFDTKTWVQFV